MRGCNEARPNREWGEQGIQLQRPSAESARTRGASVSEPAALKVQLGEGLCIAEVARIWKVNYCSGFAIWESTISTMGTVAMSRGLL